MPDWLLSGSARRLAEELEEDGVKLDEHDSVRELLFSLVGKAVVVTGASSGVGA